MRRFVTLVSLWVLFGAIAQAGTPVDKKMVCPVGKKPFTVTGTLSCSNMGVTMSLRQVTSCDFVTQLPVCPDNGLPVYRTFDGADIKALKAFMKTDTYKSLLSQSAYYRAFVVEQHLSREGSADAYWLLQGGLWFDYEKMMAVPKVLDLYVQQAEREKERATAEDKPYMMAAVGYQLGLAGRNKDATRWLKEAKSHSDGTGDIDAYIRAVSKCLGKMTKANCQPDADFTP